MRNSPNTTESDEQRKILNKLLSNQIRLNTNATNELFNYLSFNHRLHHLAYFPIVYSTSIFLALSIAFRDIDTPKLDMSVNSLIIVAKRESYLLLMMTLSILFLNVRLKRLLAQSINSKTENTLLTIKKHDELQWYNYLFEKKVQIGISTILIATCHHKLNNLTLSDKANLNLIYLTFISAFLLSMILTIKYDARKYVRSVKNPNKIDFTNFFNNSFRLFQRELYSPSSSRKKLNFKSCKIYRDLIPFSVCLLNPQCDDYSNIIFVTLYRLGFHIIYHNRYSILFITTGLQYLEQSNLMATFHQCMDEKIETNREDFNRLRQLQKQHRKTRARLRHQNKAEPKPLDVITALLEEKHDQETNSVIRNPKADSSCKTLNKSPCQSITMANTKVKTRPKQVQSRNSSKITENDSKLLISWSNDKGENYTYHPKASSSKIFLVSDQQQTYAIFILWALDKKEFQSDKDFNDLKNKAMQSRIDGGKGQSWSRLSLNTSRQKVSYTKLKRITTLHEYQFMFKPRGTTFGDTRIFARKHRNLTSNTMQPLYIADMLCRHVH